MAMRPTKSRGKDAFIFEIKVGLLLMGGGLGLAGMLTGRSALVWTGIVLVGIGVLLRFVARGENETPRQD